MSGDATGRPPRSRAAAGRRPAALPAPRPRGHPGARRGATRCQAVAVIRAAGDGAAQRSADRQAAALGSSPERGESGGAVRAYRRGRGRSHRMGGRRRRGRRSAGHEGRPAARRLGPGPRVPQVHCRGRPSDPAAATDSATSFGDRRCRLDSPRSQCVRAARRRCPARTVRSRGVGGRARARGQGAASPAAAVRPARHRRRGTGAAGDRLRASLRTIRRAGTAGGQVRRIGKAALPRRGAAGAPRTHGRGRDRRGGASAARALLGRHEPRQRADHRR